MSKKLGIPAIITIDTHYNKFEEKMLKMSASAMAYHNKDYASSGEAFRGNTYYFMTQEEVRSNLRSMGIEDDDIDILIKNTEDLAHSVLLDLGLNFQEIYSNIDWAFGFKEYINIKYEEFKDRKLEGAPDDLIKIYDDRLNWSIIG